MDPDVALRLFEEGATLVLLGVPQGTELGIDCKSWQVGPRFRGIKMIPPGLHFLHYSAGNPSQSRGEIFLKTGFFLSLRPREILLAKWDPKEEDLDFSASKNQEEVGRIQASLQELDPYLGPYPYDMMRKWVSLTNHLSKELVQNLQPLSGRISSYCDIIPEVEFRHTEDRAQHPRNDTACTSMKEGLERLPRMKQREGTELRFSAIPKKTYPPGATPAQITQCSLDLSYALETVLKNYGPQPHHILGELQFAFVCFLVANVYEGFEHWKGLLALLCRSEEAMVKQKELYLELIAVLYHQLGEIPTDFFVDIVSQDNFLTATLQDFFQFARGSSVDGTLLDLPEEFTLE
uniref:Protein AAR2 homolog n=1 Tax=Cynoglossus semilaevis TaxID=244447 RepID=A0A3P8X123_CYNSE